MSQAWLLDFGGGWRAAVGARELVHLLYTPTSYPVPKTPAHARHVLPWQDHLLPVFNLANWLGDKQHVTVQSVVGVFAYQNKRREAPRYGALWLAGPPVRLSVEDHQACDFPEPVAAWERLAVACFEHEGTAFPILDLQRIYGTVPELLPSPS